MNIFLHQSLGIASHDNASRDMSASDDDCCDFKAHGNNDQLSNHFIITTIATSNFIGIVFARTLHYQFYVWYFHMIPYLLWHSVALPLAVKLFVFVSIEVAFNIYPATAWSSLLLQVRINNSNVFCMNPLEIRNISRRSVLTTLIQFIFVRCRISYYLAVY